MHIALKLLSIVQHMPTIDWYNACQMSVIFKLRSIAVMRSNRPILPTLPCRVLKVVALQSVAISVGHIF